jgi:Transposase.
MKTKFTEEQIAYALKQAEHGTSVADVIRKMGISEQKFYRWKKKYGGFGHERTEAPKAVGGREPQTEADGCGSEP